MVLYKWGVVCSVPDSVNLLTEIADFFKWMLPRLSANAETLMLIREFEAEPTFMYRCDPKDRSAVEDAYAQAEDEHPGVMFVFHILPYRNSAEFNWLKELSKKHWQIGQGILVDNVHTKFDGVQLDDVLANINQYISRRFAEVMSKKRPENGGRVLFVNGDKAMTTSYRSEELADSVRLVLHNTRFLEDEQVPNAIIVSGYPPSYSSANIASLFDKLRITTVQPIRPNACFVQFENNTQALQALLNRHGFDLGSGYCLDLQPTSASLKKQVLEAKELWQELGSADKFPYA